jgi:SAM-dependent methyltransferase
VAAEGTPRAGYESLDVSSREKKAEKIKAILGSDRELAGASVLEVGVGSGIIAACFAELVGRTGAVWGVDIRDSRLVKEGFQFVRTESTSLPFEDEFFDVVLSNHVIEHVGTRADQLTHLREIARVLKADGVAYLATPNRWTLLEPHFRLPLLSWLPAKARTPYVRLARRGERYDCDPLSRAELLALCMRAGFDAEERTLEAIRLTAEIEDVPSVVGRIAEAPEIVHRALLPLVPTFNLLLRRDRADTCDRGPVSRRSGAALGGGAHGDRLGPVDTAASRGRASPGRSSGSS